MNISPLLRQIFVAASPQLAAFSVGGVTGFPSVLLHQFAANDSSIHVDFDTSSWIASVQGIASVPSMLISLIMQWRGRKFAFILDCLLIITGWTLLFIAKNTTVVIIGECIQGLGSNSIIMVSLLTISEMVDPKLRGISMLLFVIMHTFGLIVVTIIGYFVYWKTVSLIMFAPLMTALLMACTWPDSPSWLAWKGEFEKSEQAFIWLRGSGEESKKELSALIQARKEEWTNKTSDKPLNLFHVIMNRDFHLPAIHMILILTTYYWSGTIALFMYAIELIKKTTGIESTILCIGSIDTFILLGSSISIFLVKYLKNKLIILISCFCCAFCMLCASIVTYLQSVGLLSAESLLFLYCILGHALSSTSGKSLLAPIVSAELMPVKYRGFGGILYDTTLAVLYTSSIKSTPYLILYIGYWGTFTVFALVDIIGSLLIWKYVPETKNRTLQEIEDYYNVGYFKKHDDEELATAEYFVKNTE